MTFYPMTVHYMNALVCRRAQSLLLLAAALLLPLGAQAQPTTSPPDAPSRAAAEAPRTAYLVRSADMLPVVLMSARTSLTGEADGFAAAAADVVVVGPAVKGLVTGGPHAAALTKSLDAGVRVVACGLAMKKTGVTEGDLLDGIDTAPNGFHELFRLEAKGYVTLQL
ncbi:DsrE family protein [Salinibacter ruber]|uniref:Intracellular sulfur oxidation DsrE/DsrF family protein n=2 Tax=Salinibacter ruber TaxID=146919 RepID=A0A9X2TEF3_9BACT|nr:DsrE family protein [Salinibacter ruber]MCS3709405.1 intracellular sulfur oxidation DsrE/DsrF family protein [Salinibacter ruber]MCS4097718.1 intracellular sulfur oxidation DsrE/DsrF family protein [Salinibacter ruber]MCS4183869.1 intracellular sulfur oxidation DsrE/DsrF family protein [Salinibacter ruber]